MVHMIWSIFYSLSLKLGAYAWTFKGTISPKLVQFIVDILSSKAHTRGAWDGKGYPDLVLRYISRRRRVYCTVFVHQNLKFSVGGGFECPDFEFELDFDRQTPHSSSGQRCPPTSDYVGDPAWSANVVAPIFYENMNRSFWIRKLMIRSKKQF